MTRFVQGFGTALLTSRVDTDYGEGFIKTLGTPEGPHPLACELVGSLAADWLGATTLDFSLIDVDVDDLIPLANGSCASPGKAFISRAEDHAFTWGGDPQTLGSVQDRQAFGHLVVVDTWLRNCDRHAPDGRRINLKNVFLRQKSEPRRLELIAMDFTHALTCGGALDKRIGQIERIQDDKIYGLFDEFKPYISPDLIASCCDRLAMFNGDVAQSFLNLVPDEWQVEPIAKSNIRRFLVERAHFLAGHLVEILWPATGKLFREADHA